MFFRRDNIERENRQHRAIHRHRHAHLIKRNAREQRAHVINRINRDTGHADIAFDARMIGIITTMRRKIEGNRKALLTCCEIAAVKCV